MAPDQALALTSYLIPSKSIMSSAQPLFVRIVLFGLNPLSWVERFYLSDKKRAWQTFSSCGLVKQFVMHLLLWMVKPPRWLGVVQLAPVCNTAGVTYGH